MSFLDKFKNKGWGKRSDSDSDLPFEEMAASPGKYDGAANADGTATLDMNATMAHVAATNDSSIISEAAPSEMAGDFTETRIQGDGFAPTTAGSGLPLI